MKASPLRSVPAVEKVRQALGDTGLPRALTVWVVRREVAKLKGAGEAIPDFATVVERVRSVLATLRQSRLQPVINGTGVIVHTNLGRAPLGPAVVEALARIAANYSNLEFDLARGERGPRAAYLEQSLALLCGAEAATVVNNCAAALVLVLRHFAVPPRDEVVISRGELVQIGGGFRIPEILEASGARLREVGTTNRTSVADYAKAVGRQTAMILKVHRSNFFMGGFVESPATEELAALARRKRLPLVEDLGSGAVVATEKLAPIEHEPTPAEVLKRGIDLVCFSGDKLLGGPQAGVIAGKARWITALKREPFYRALRCDKLILSALQTTVDICLDGTAERSVPVLDLLGISEEALRARADRIIRGLDGLALKASIGKSSAQTGGGSLPRSLLPSLTLDLVPVNLTLPEFASRLRGQTPPIIGYIAGGRYKLDLRTIFPTQDGEITKGISGVLRAR